MTAPVSSGDAEDLRSAALTIVALQHASSVVRGQPFYEVRDGVADRLEDLASRLPSLLAVVDAAEKFFIGKTPEQIAAMDGSELWDALADWGDVKYPEPARTQVTDPEETRPNASSGTMEAAPEAAPTARRDLTDTDLSGGQHDG